MIFGAGSCRIEGLGPTRRRFKARFLALQSPYSQRRCLFGGLFQAPKALNTHVPSGSEPPPKALGAKLGRDVFYSDLFAAPVWQLL